jgi:hypothetical protein
MTWTDKEADPKSIYLVVMNNIFVDFKVGLRFDLKGSTNNRTVLKGDMKPEDLGPIAMKDNDFRKHMGEIVLFDKAPENLSLKTTNSAAREDIKDFITSNSRVIMMDDFL